MACIKKRRGKWVVDYRDSQGRRHWESKPDKRTAQDRLSEILKGENVAPLETRTFREYGAWWLENVAKGSIAESTYLEYEAVLRNHVYPVLGDKPFLDVKRADIRELIAAKKDRFSQSTIRNIMAPVRGMYNQAIEDDSAARNPAARIGKHNKVSKDKPKKKIDPLTREEIQVFLKTASDKKYTHWYPLFLCACRTGLRMGELISLKGTDLDFNGRFVHVQRNLSRGKISATKNGKDRKVDMSGMLAGVLTELLSSRRSQALQEEMKKPGEERRDRDVVVNEVMEDWLFQTLVTARSELARRRRPDAEARGGSQLDPSNLRKVFNRLLIDAKLRRVRFHDLRHSFASLLLQNGESPTYVKEQMGHSSINVTVDIYGHLVPGGNRAAVDKLDIEVAVEAGQEAVAK
ncbi:MAG: site-specific integrase [Candidatus Binatia bacterium]